MRLLRVRLTVRWMMALVIGFALALWGLTFLPEYPFKAYPLSPAMYDNIQLQRNSQGVGRYGVQVLKLMIFPTGSSKLAVQFRVDTYGRVDSIENIYAWATQGATVGQLTDEEMK